MRVHKRLFLRTASVAVICLATSHSGFATESVELGRPDIIQPMTMDTAVPSATIVSVSHDPASALIGTEIEHPSPNTSTAKSVQHNVTASMPPNGIETPRGPKCGRYAENGCVRSGCPDCIHPFAKCAVTGDRSVGYIGGGGSLLHGEPRTIEEGAFGLDYSGHWFSRKVWLLWNHGSKHQGGAGAYASDGPRILPE